MKIKFQFSNPITNLSGPMLAMLFFLFESARYDLFCTSVIAEKMVMVRSLSIAIRFQLHFRYSNHSLSQLAELFPFIVHWLYLSLPESIKELFLVNFYLQCFGLDFNLGCFFSFIANFLLAMLNQLFKHPPLVHPSICKYHLVGII